MLKKKTTTARNKNNKATALMFDYSALAVFGLYCMFNSLGPKLPSGRKSLRAEVFAEQIFAKLFQFQAINHDKKVRQNLQNIEQSQKFVLEKLMIFQFKKTDLKHQLNHQ